MLYIIYTVFNKGLSEGMLFPYPKSEVKIAINYRRAPLFCRSKIFGMYTKDVSLNGKILLIDSLWHDVLR